MIQLYSENSEGVTVTNGSSIIFENEKLQKGCCTFCDTPSNTISIKRAGTYLINFSAIVSSSDATGGLINVVIKNNDIADDSSQAGVQSSSTDDIESISLNSIINVRPSCRMVNNNANIKFEIAGIDTVVYYANVTVTKIE